MKTKFVRIILLFSLAGILLLASCAAKKPWYGKASKNWAEAIPPGDEQVAHTVFLVGDAGDAKHGTESVVPSLNLLQKELEAAGANSTLVWLGDNIYPIGLPPEDHPGRAEAEYRIGVELEISKKFQGKTYFIPGNHDWNLSQPGGWDAVKREEAYLEKALGPDVFVPNDGCPGPTVVRLAPGLTMVALDSEWPLHKHEKPLEECGIHDEEGFYFALQDSLNEHSDDILLVTAHHPAFTNGNHGGQYPWGFYAGIITSIYPLGRKLGASPQDQSHPLYKRYSNWLKSIFPDYERLVFAAGHEHSLQHWKKEGTQYLVSGAGCKDSYCSKGRGSEFSHQHTGFMKLKMYQNQELWVEVWEPGETEAIMVYRAKLY
ncbi:MAG: metallophosphoesterase [Bacteroidia bacterium]|nr:metallophosphoesterase [Bacteroidia bacterium]